MIYAGHVAKATTANMLFGWDKTAFLGDDPDRSSTSLSPIPLPTFFSNPLIHAAIQDVFALEKNNLRELSDDAIVKICRQIEFWYTDGGVGDAEGLAKIAQSLLDQSQWYTLTTKGKSLLEDDDVDEKKEEFANIMNRGDANMFKVPTTRFGRTNIQIPLITCGGMRLQHTWCPDSVPIISPNRKEVLSMPTQTNIEECIKHCLRLGINHFETARLYGTSEYQLVDALVSLMEKGELKREDFIFQTKIVAGDEKSFDKNWKATWDNVKKLGHVDLFSLHAISFYDDHSKASLNYAKDLRSKGLVKNIGFSTHATAEQVMALINTEEFDYVNLHYHYFGSYHGSGTPDTKGGEGHAACVARARELDMGVFQISPCDKGGKLYRPSAELAKCIGKELTPIGFALLFAWRRGGIDTSSIGIARPSDLDEAMGAVRLMNLHAKGEVDVDVILDGVISRLEKKFEDSVGKEWAEKGLLNLPTCYKEATEGVFLGHILWLHNLLTAFGMYEFCEERYISLEFASWDKNKSFKENADKM